MISYSLAEESWGIEEYNVIKAVVASKQFTMGKKVKEFEEKFAKYIDSKYSVMVNSGSSANLLAIAALFFKKTSPLKRGDEVIVPALSWPTTFSPLYQYGLNLKFVDIDLHTLNYDLNILQDAITEKTKIILAVNLCGNPNDFKRLQEIINDRNIILMEDNCESMGATFEEKKTGTFGLVGTFSTFFSHHISTMEGGIIATDNEEIYHILLSLRAHGWTRELPKNNLLTDLDLKDPFENLWKFILPGYNVRPLELSGAIGIEQLKKLPDFVKIRRMNAQFFQKTFNDDANFIIQKEIGRSSYFGFSLIIKPNSGFNRDAIIKLLNSNSIESRPIFSGNFVKTDAIKFFNYETVGKLINANIVHTNGFIVGNHHFDIREKIEYLKRILYSESP